MPVTHTLLATLLGGVALSSLHGPLLAQGGPRQRVEVSVGAGLFGGATLGEHDANLRANSTTSEPYRIFEADTTFASAPALEARAGVALTPRYSVEATFSFSRPELRASVASDAEDAPALVVVERVDQYLIAAGLVVMLDELRVGSLVPFAAGGAGYLRQLHEGQTLVEEGHFYHAGGGVKHWLFSRIRGVPRAAGLRIDARMVFLDGGIAFSDGLRPQGAISGSVFLVF